MSTVSAGLVKVENLTSAIVNSTASTIASVAGDATINSARVTINTTGDISRYNNGLPNSYNYPNLSVPPAREIYEGLSQGAIDMIEGVIATMSVLQIACTMTVATIPDDTFTNPYPGLTNIPFNPGVNDPTFANFLLNNYNYYHPSGVNYPPAGFPLFLNLNDVLRGPSTNLTFPSPIARVMGQSWDPELIGNFCEYYARNFLRPTGVLANFGFQADHNIDGLTDGRSAETFGEDPVLIKRFIKAQNEGFKNGGCSKSIKHVFEGLDNKIRSCGLKRYRETFVGSYADIKDCDHILIGNYQSSFGLNNSTSKYINTIIRNYFQFNGVIIQDYSITGDVMNNGAESSFNKAIADTLDSGVDCISQYVAPNPIPSIQNWIENGNLESAKNSVRRIFTRAYKYKLFPQQPDFISPLIPGNVDGTPNVDTNEFFNTITSNVTYNNTVLDIARKSICLLKNDGVLPLSLPGDRVAITGPAGNTKSAHIGPWAGAIGTVYNTLTSEYPINENYYSIIDGLNIIYASNVVNACQPLNAYDLAAAVDSLAYDTSAGFAPTGPQSNPVNDASSNVLPKFIYNSSDIAQTLVDVSDCDTVVIAIGWDIPLFHDEGAAHIIGGDLNGTYTRLNEKYTGYDIPRNEQRLIEAVLDAGKKVVLVYCGYVVKVVPDYLLSRVSAFIHAGVLGSYGGQVIAETLFGINNPSAHLTISWPRHSGNFEKLVYNVTEIPGLSQSGGYFGDYYFSLGVNLNGLKSCYNPAFPFGHGLSYCTDLSNNTLTFTHTNMVTSINLGANILNVSLTTTNDSMDTSGNDLVVIYDYLQYSNLPECSDTAWKVLDFTRVALAPGESKTVSFQIPLHLLSIVVGDIQEQLIKQLCVPATTYLITDGHHQQQFIDYLSNIYLISFDISFTVDLAPVVSSTGYDSNHILGSFVTLDTPLFFDKYNPLQS